jgi:hypothetical protein
VAWVQIMGKSCDGSGLNLRCAISDGRVLPFIEKTLEADKFRSHAKILPDLALIFAD